VRAIGVSNFSPQEVAELVAFADPEIGVHVVQDWMDPFHQAKELRRVCALNGIVFAAYSSLGGQWIYQVRAAET